MITELKSNLKSGNVQTVSLGEKTLIVGDSASGKSAITQALELTVTGRLSDFQGRTDSAHRTVKDYLGPVIECTGGAARLPYRLVREAVTSSGLSALVDLAGGAAPVLLPQLQLLKALQRQVKDAADRSRGFTTATEVVESIAASSEATVVRRMLAAGYTQAELDKERARERVQELVTGLWPDLVDAMYNLTVAADKFVPGRLGGLTIAYGTAESPACIVMLGNRVALSGSEWNIALTAIACALAKADDLVIPDDRAIDADLLSDWLACLSNAPCQVVLTSIGLPTILDKQWTILNTSGSLSGKRPKDSASQPPGSTTSQKSDASGRKSAKTGVGSSSRRSRPVPAGES